MMMIMVMIKITVMMTGHHDVWSNVLLKTQKCVSSLRMCPQIRKRRKQSVFQSDGVNPFLYSQTKLLQSDLIQLSDVC